MIAWGFQTAGILLGAHWAYAVLGWGGYWAWDPVENASLLPWLTGTAFLHSVMMQEKRGMMKVWNVWLVFIHVPAVHLRHVPHPQRRGEFRARLRQIQYRRLVRRISWRHSARVPRGVFQESRLSARARTSSTRMVSRESSFLFNNLILLVSCVAVLSGTLFPVFSEWLRGDQISVGTPFFNKVNIPIGLLLLFLTGVGPLLAWRKTSLDSLKRNFGWPLLIGLVAGALLSRLASANSIL